MAAVAGAKHPLFRRPVSDGFRATPPLSVFDSPLDAGE